MVQWRRSGVRLTEAATGTGEQIVTGGEAQRSGGDEEGVTRNGYVVWETDTATE